MISLSRSQHSSLLASLARLPSRVPSFGTDALLAVYARVPRHLLWAGIFVVAVAASVPAMRVYSAVPFNLVNSTSETTGKPVTAIVLTQDTLDAYAGPSVSSALDVRTQTDLVDLAATLMREDRSIQRISIGSDTLSMTYRSSVDVLRFGRRIIERTVTVTKSGTVAVTKPWYAAIANEKKTIADPQLGFADINIITDSGGISIPTAAKLLIRMHGRLQIGAI